MCNLSSREFHAEENDYRQIRIALRLAGMRFSDMMMITTDDFELWFENLEPQPYSNKLFYARFVRIETKTTKKTETVSALSVCDSTSLYMCLGVVFFCAFE